MAQARTVGRSDATERSLPFHWDIDPARMMRPRFADSIRASSPSGLREQAGHMTASDFCAANVRDPSEIERAIAAFARSGNGGLIVTGSGLAGVHRHVLISLAARHKLPAVSPSCLDAERRGRGLDGAELAGTQG